MSVLYERFYYWKLAGNCSFLYSPDPMNQGMINFIAMPVCRRFNSFWSFGDGTSGSGFNPSHTYVTAGTYTVCMNEIDPNGTTFVLLFVGSLSSNANCSFTTSIDSVQANLVYFNFTPNSFNSQVMWDFGDGSAGMGSKHATLLPTTGSIQCLCNRNQSVNRRNHLLHLPGDHCELCSKLFIHCCAWSCWTRNTLTLTGVVGAGNIASWDFGDGTVGTGSPIQHTYAQPGIYHICVVRSRYTSAYYTVYFLSGHCSWFCSSCLPCEFCCYQPWF